MCSEALGPQRRSIDILVGGDNEGLWDQNPGSPVQNVSSSLRTIVDN